MVYPTFTVNTKAINIASVKGYCPHFDIVWSFEYAISGNNNTEAGFTVFLMDNIPLSGGNGNIDLGYSGLSSYGGVSSTIEPGISGGILGVGFDTTGFFAVSALSGVAIIRDGIDESLKIPNSISMRGGWPTYSYNTYNFNAALSSIDSDFKIVESEVKFKTIRARLGNVGKTLYIDYRYDIDTDFKPILQYDVNLNIADSTKYKVGLSFSTPICSNSLSSIGNIYIKNFHTEGSVVSGDITSYYIPGVPECITILPVRKTTPPDITTIPKIPAVIIPISDGDSICSKLSIVSGKLSSTNANINITEDLYNFGYKVLIYNNSGIFSELTRISNFAYKSTNEQYILFKTGVCNYWSLSSPNFLIANNSVLPIGTYNTSITAIYI